MTFTTTLTLKGNVNKTHTHIKTPYLGHTKPSFYFWVIKVHFILAPVLLRLLDEVKVCSDWSIIQRMWGLLFTKLES